MEKLKAQVRSLVEHPFQVIKRIFRYEKSATGDWRKIWLTFTRSLLWPTWSWLGATFPAHVDNERKIHPRPPARGLWPFGTRYLGPARRKISCVEIIDFQKNGSETPCRRKTQFFSVSVNETTREMLSQFLSLPEEIRLQIPRIFNISFLGKDEKSNLLLQVDEVFLRFNPVKLEWQLLPE